MLVADYAEGQWQPPAIQPYGPVESFAQGDPYVMNGLVTQWSVRAWTQVVATTPGEDALIRRR